MKNIIEDLDISMLCHQIAKAYFDVRKIKNISDEDVVNIVNHIKSALNKIDEKTGDYPPVQLTNSNCIILKPAKK